MRIDHMLLGYCDVRVEPTQATAFLNLCRERGFVYLPRRGKQDEALQLRCRRSVAGAMLAACAACGIEMQVERAGGLPVFALRYCRRVGLLIGVLLAAVLFWLSGRVVWDVRIEGEGEFHTPDLEDALAAAGLWRGQWIPTMDTDAVEERLLQSDAGVAWVSVNLKGTVAYVQVRPLLMPSQEEAASEPGNLVAAVDGVVESVRLMAGEVVVRPGELVRAGQLLIAGVRDIGESGFALTAARGQVMARVTRQICIEIPLVEEQKVYIGEQIPRKTLFFFGKEIKVTKNAGNLPDNCDIIKQLEVYCLPGGAALPISVETELVCPYEWRTVALTPDEARAQAELQLGPALTQATREATLLSTSVRYEESEQLCRLICTYECLENIAVTQPIQTAP